MPREVVCYIGSFVTRPADILSLAATCSYFQRDVGWQGRQVLRWQTLATSLTTTRQCPASKLFKHLALRALTASHRLDKVVPGVALPTLTSLCVDGASFFGPGNVAHLLPSLTGLCTLRLTRATPYETAPSVLTVLQGLTGLTDLSLGPYMVPAEHLRDLTALTALQVYEPRGQCKDWAPALRQLRQLSLTLLPGGQADLWPETRGLSSLTSVTLANVNGIALGGLFHCTTLDTLTIESGDLHLEPLHHVSQLRHLVIQGPVVVHGLQSIKYVERRRSLFGMAQLESIVIDVPAHAWPAGSTFQATDFNKLYRLRSLTLRNAPNFEFAFVARLYDLETLSVHYREASQRHTETSIAPHIASLAHLTSLNVENHWTLDDAGLTQTLRAHRALCTVSFRHCRTLPADILRAVSPRLSLTIVDYTK